MNIQVKACFIKESLAFFRTKRFFIIALVIIGLSAFSPLMISGLGFLMDAMSDIYEEFGMDVSDMTQFLISSSSTGVVSSISDITGAGLIVFLLLINRAAGGEQKKRAEMIPRSVGLSSFAYIFPKYIIYPLSGFVLAICAMFVSWGISAWVFDVNDVTFTAVLLAGVLTGVTLMMYISFHLALGTATSRAGMSAAICIAASILVPGVLQFATSEYMFNPFTLELLAANTIAADTVTGSDITDILVTIVFALALMTASFFIALFAQNAKRIDNSGDDIEL